jgi:MarR family transcriptional regulator, organic hydroperoxide resistance regulator
VGIGEVGPGDAVDALRRSGGDDPSGPPRQDPVDRGILDALTDLVKQAGAISHSIAASFGVAPSDLLALFKLSDGVLSMKELAQRIGCDASFVTVIADTLEREGLARREPSQRDRRVKNLVLTPKGTAAQERLMHELATRMPWCNGLDEAERQCFLRLLNKMLASQRGEAGHMRESGSARRATTVRSE